MFDMMMNFFTSSLSKFKLSKGEINKINETFVMNKNSSLTFFGFFTICVVYLAL